MQNDSNPQTSDSKISRFPRLLAEDMFNQQTKFGEILHIPTLSVSEQVPEAFEDFLGSMDCADNLIKHHPQFSGLFESFKEYTDRDWNEEHACNLARICTDFEFLVLIESSIPREFKFTDDGKFFSCSIGGHYQLDWIFAKDMKHAAEQAIKIAEEIHDRKEQEARKEQGLEG